MVLVELRLGDSCLFVYGLGKYLLKWVLFKGIFNFIGGEECSIVIICIVLVMLYILICILICISYLGFLR